MICLIDQHKEKAYNQVRLTKKPFKQFLQTKFGHQLSEKLSIVLDITAALDLTEY
jgi:hypothetical protein